MKPKGVPVNVSEPMVINVVENETDTDTTGEEYYEESESDMYTSTNSGADSDEDEYPEFGYDSDSDDTIYDYPYDLNEFKKSSALKAPSMIKGRLIETIFDSGASCSLISRYLAKELKLLPIGDTLPISGIDTKKKLGKEVGNMADITTSVPIRVGSKLRPEHMVISDNCDDDTLILGIPWLKKYGVILDLKKKQLLSLPRKVQVYLFKV
ncbi:hypothetical protein ABG067_008227, partial [Albugo candida]